LNLRPSGYEPDELPDCSTPRLKIILYFIFRLCQAPSAIAINFPKIINYLIIKDFTLTNMKFLTKVKNFEVIRFTNPSDLFAGRTDREGIIPSPTTIEARERIGNGKKFGKDS
jgi:hypothetical protein